MKKANSIILLLIMLLLLSCASPFSAAPAVTENAAPQTEAPTFTAPPPLPTQVTEPTVPPTATPYSPITVSIMADHVNIRSNPGLLFNVVRNVSQGTKIQVLGKSPGGEWFLIQDAGGEQGWVFGKLLESDLDLQAAPVIMPANVMVLEGRITAVNGQPVSGIQFAFVQDQANQVLRNDGNSDENGVFLVFMPPDIGGNWTVSYTAIACTSNTMDADCNCLNETCGKASPSVQTISVPQVEPVLFSWVYTQ